MNFKGKTAVIVCHDAMFGPPHELRDYLLKNKIKQLLFIGHPNRAMYDNHIKSSFFQYYWNGNLKSTYTTPEWKLPELIGYMKDFFLTIIWTIVKIRGSIDFFVGLGNMNAFSGLFVQLLGLSNKTIYYVIDYIPFRYGNHFVNWFYHWVDMMSARFSYVTWNYAERMIKERKKRWKREFSRQIVVPNGVHIRKGNNTPFKKIHAHELVYLGTLSKQQGIQMILQALSLIRKEIFDVTFTIIGKGNYRKILEMLVKKYNLSDCVSFLGFIEDSNIVDKRISHSALGIATYDPTSSYVIYAEPGKVKRYLACGVPVIMTNVGPLAKEVFLNKCGLVCAYDSTIIFKEIVSFLKNQKHQQKYRRMAYKFAVKYQWKNIFDKAFLYS